MHEFIKLTLKLGEWKKGKKKKKKKNNLKCIYFKEVLVWDAFSH